jgi:hypothetical protein
VGPSNKTPRRRATTLAAGLCAAAWLVAAPAHGQDPLVEAAPGDPLAGQLFEEQADEPVTPGAEGSTMADAVAGDPAIAGDGAFTGNVGIMPDGHYAALPYAPGYAPAVQAVNWISGPYLRSGVALGMGGSVLNNPEAGYSIAGGYRTPLGPAFDERLFLDVGVSYLSVFGSTTHLTSGRLTSNNVTTVLPFAFNSTLKEIRRIAAQAAVGWYWGDLMDDRSNDPQLRIATRFGGRVGHVRGDFDDEPLISSTFTPNYGKTDSMGGLFVGTEAILLQRDTQVGSVAWTLDGELSNDWVLFEAFESGNVGTATIMLGMMITR